MYKSILALGFLISGLAMAAVSATPVVVTKSTWAQLFTEPVWATITFVIVGWFSSPLTSYLKKWFKTEGDQTKRLNYLITFVLTTIITAMHPFVVGQYQFSFQSLLYVIVVAVVRSITDQGTYQRDVQARVSAVAKSAVSEPTTFAQFPATTEHAMTGMEPDVYQTGIFLPVKDEKFVDPNLQ